LGWSNLLLHLPLELLNLEALLFELSIDQEKVCQALGKEIIPLLNLIRKCLAVMPI
jgi:hypothetical protein